MTGVEEPEEFPDAFDREVLERLRALHDRIDPPPPVLDDLVRFALGGARVDQELARLVTEDESVVVARGSSGTKTVAFEAGESSLLLTVVELAGDRVRVDGWLAPAAEVDIEVRVLSELVWTERVRTDPGGRFVVASLPRGRVQLVVQTQPPVITPATSL
jgi:hypothetical protein